MFYDANGKPDLNGQFEIKGGRLTRRASTVLHPGEQVHFDISLTDAASTGRVFLTDSQRNSDEHAWAREVRDAARGTDTVGAARAAMIADQSKASLAAIEGDPRKAWKRDERLRDAKAVRDAALAARYR